MQRYRLIVLCGDDKCPQIQVVDCDRGREMFVWHGDVARHLLESGALNNLESRPCGCFPCEKSQVLHLALIAASANKGVEPSFPAESGVGAGGNTVTCWRELSVSSAYSTTVFSLGQVLKYVTVLPLATVPRYPPSR